MNFPLATGAVISQANAAFATQNRVTMLSQAAVPGGSNHHGCSLN